MKNSRTENNRPLVSIIIPTYNRSRFLRQAVDSALAQTYPNVEVIVVDDGSTDDTPAAMAGYDEQAHYIRQPNRGVAAARNTGIYVARGEYLSFLDDDDLFLPRKIEAQVHVMDRWPRAGLVHCCYHRADREGNYLDKPRLLPQGDVLQELMRWNFVWMGGPLVRRECLERVGVFDESIPSVTADWDLWLRIAAAGYPFGCAQEPLGVYRIHPGSMMSDVTGVEHGALAVLDKAFSDPSLPGEMAASKPQVLARVRFWLSCLYYDAGQWEDGRRNLALALSLAPYLLKERARITQTLVNIAMSRRIDDPLRFVADVLEHLPPVASSLRRYELDIFCQIYLRLALRNYGAGRIAQARKQLATALALGLDKPGRNEALIRSLAYNALHLPVADPVRYVDTVLNNLPPQAQVLSGVRSRVLAKIHKRMAQQHHLEGRRWAAAGHVLAAVRCDLPSAWNAGTIALLLKVLFDRGDQETRLGRAFLRLPLAHSRTRRMPISPGLQAEGDRTPGRGLSSLQSSRPPTAGQP